MLRAGIASTPVTTTTAIAAGQRKRVTHPDQARDSVPGACGADPLADEP